MLDKKKLVLFGSLAVVVVALVVAFIVWMLTSLGSDSGGEARPSTSPSQSASVSPEIAAFTPQLEQTAVAVATAASSWSSAATPETRVQQYRNAGMSAEYASVYKPIWAGVFSGTTMSEVTSSVRTKPVLMEATGDLGYLTFKVAVPVDWRASWNFGNGQKFQSGSNPWILTVDEHTGLVTAVDQPAVDDIDITLDRPSS